MAEQNGGPERRWHIGTIEGASFIISVLLLIVVFYHIIPELQRFGDYITKDTQSLQEAISVLQVEQDKLAQQICTTNFDREIAELKSSQILLNELERKGSVKVKDQALATFKEIETLIAVLDAEEPKPAPKRLK